MAKRSHLETTLKKATIELLLLKLLDEDDKYGYQLSGELKRRSGGQYRILEGSMYPILYRLTENGYVSFYEKKAGVRQTRVYYHLEDAGKRYLASLLASYHSYMQVIDFLLHSREGDCYEPEQTGEPLPQTGQTTDSV